MIKVHFWLNYDYFPKNYKCTWFNSVEIYQFQVILFKYDQLSMIKSDSEEI